ncbi:MAG: protein kinase [Planctomycetes bacterium]|nr:protein kinase [Planctomycetota bacterium]
MSAPVKGYRVGNYELLAKIGEGGMGAVYRARQLPIDREVALKLLPPELARDREFIERFLREARATAKLNHPNIIAGIDVGQADGYYYFAMEYVHGETLRCRIDREGPLHEREVAHIGAGIASALAHAHAAGLIHRDVKPDNVLLDQEGTPKLADLGLVMGYRDDSTLTKAGNTVGTPHYIAPEQAAGDVKLDGRADMYALGCTLYHAATGYTPFDGPSSAVVMLKHLKDKMPHPQQHVPDLTDEFCAVLERMVARDRDDRFDDLNEASELLEMLSEGQVPDLRPLAASQSNFIASNRRAKPAPARAKPEGHHASSQRLRPVRLHDHRDRRRSSGALWIAGAVVGAGLLALLVFLIGSGPSGLSQENPRKAAAADIPQAPVAAKAAGTSTAAPAKPAPAKTAPAAAPGPAKVIEAPPLPDMAAPRMPGTAEATQKSPTPAPEDDPEPRVQTILNSNDPAQQANADHIRKDIFEPMLKELMQKNPKVRDISGRQISLEADQEGNPVLLRADISGLTDLTAFHRLKKLEAMALGAKEGAPKIDLSFLEGMNLKVLSLSSVPVKSYEPLKKTSLQELIIDPFDLKTLSPVLKGMKNLKTINKIPAADLLK